MLRLSELVDEMLRRYLCHEGAVVGHFCWVRRVDYLTLGKG